MRTAEEAVAAARREAEDASRDWYRLCLAFVRICWDIAPSGIPDADAAWERSKDRHGGRNPPAGAPVY